MRILLLIISFLSAVRAAESPLNFIVMLVDDMGATDLGCTGSKFYKTPHIDRLAREGVMFTRAYSACTVCSPTRAALLTGKYPARLHITDWIAGHARPAAKLLPPDWVKELPAAEITLPEMLQPKGYVSGTFGKWHLGNELPTAHGFAVNIGGHHRGQPETWFSPYKNPALADGPPGEFLTERLTAEAEKFITQHKDRPFFLYYPHYAVHTPLGGKEEVIEKYRAAAQPDAPQRNPVYASMVESVDDSVGRLRAKLEELQIADRTVFIFTSDNGGLLGGAKNPITTNLGLRAGKGSACEGGVRVPLIIHWPGVSLPGTECSTPVITMDLCATMAAASGVKAPDDGVDLRPLLRGENIQPRELYWHYPHYHPGGATPYSAVLSEGLRLVHFHEDERVELYDLAADPGEKNDLAPTRLAARESLKKKLEAWLKQTVAQMPAPNPKHEPAKDR
jgi:arylsulfatase A